MKNKRAKILISGVGGQGIVFLTNILTEAALISGVPVCASEIHGLSQRGGVVTAGIGIGRNCTGFIGESNVDILIGLEFLETQRCLRHLHSESRVIFGKTRIEPFSVKDGTFLYPEAEPLLAWMRNNILDHIYVDEFPEGISQSQSNVFLLGAALSLDNFPFTEETMIQAMRNTITEGLLNRSLVVFSQGRAWARNHKKELTLNMKS
ncbi:MAG: 2-oxoacid:acceptor oxidoreductase family protein [Bacteroidia bacterium]|nr:2-oxoacid:acceptor oxidoreductase family protein [Bacteroidia bacterium]